MRCQKSIVKPRVLHLKLITISCNISSIAIFYNKNIKTIHLWQGRKEIKAEEKLKNYESTPSHTYLFYLAFLQNRP